MAKSKADTPKAEEQPAVVDVVKLLTRDEAVAKFKRDEHGLLINTNYIFKDDGSVFWKEMIPKKDIVVNTDYFEKRQMAVPTSIDGLEDKQLLVLLSGLKELMKLRGVEQVTRDVIECNHERAVVRCRIVFTENYETRAGMPVIFEEVANATVANTNSFASMFLETIASNRAFVRALRNGLRIDIVGSDELASFVQTEKNEPTEGAEAWNALAEAAKEYSTAKHPEGFKNFAEFKAVLIEKKTEGAEGWQDWKDIPPSTIFKLISLLKKAKTT